MADPIDELPTPPSRSDAPATFISRANAFIAALVNFVTQLNIVARAFNFNSTNSTSTTELTIGTGAKSLTVDDEKSYLPGQTVKIARTSDGTKWMLGDVTSYNSGTGALDVTVSKIQSSGTFTDWTITLSPTDSINDGDKGDISVSGAGSVWTIDNEAVTPAKQSPAAKTAKIQDIDASVSGNALTITINPTTLDFRSTTLTDGTPTTVNLDSAATLTVPSGATLGTANTVAARLAVLAINNAGTIEVAVTNLAGGNQLDETNLINTTTIGTGADSKTGVYSTTGRSSVAYRVVGYIDITEATAGTWAAAPTLVQGAGGNAVTALQSLGYSQTWQDMSGSRTHSTSYVNTTGRPIVVNIGVTASTGRLLAVDGVTVANCDGSGSAEFMSAVVPPGSTYSISGLATIITWAELR